MKWSTNSMLNALQHQKLDDFFSLKTLSHCVLTDLNAFAWLNKTAFSSLLQGFSLEVRGPAFVCEDKCVRLSKCSSVCVCAFSGIPVWSSTGHGRRVVTSPQWRTHTDKTARDYQKFPNTPGRRQHKR